MAAQGTAHRSNCQDCGSPLTGPFCATCGQHDVDYHRSFGHVVEDSLESVLHLDGKFFRSMRYLFTRPGFLTKEFIDGRRTRYSHPIRFYIFASFLYFAASAVFAPPDVVRQNPAAGGAPTAPAGTKPGAIATTKVPLSGSTDQTDWPWLNRRMKAARDAYGDQYTKVLTHEIAHLLPSMLFLCMPILALLLKAAYPGSGHYYIEHLIFALHTLTLVFLGSVVTDLVQAALQLIGPGASQFFGFASFCFIGWLIYRSFRTVYGQGRGRTLFKFAFVAAAFGIVLLVGIVGVSVTSFYIVTDAA